MGTAVLSVGAGVFYWFHSRNLEIEKLCGSKPERARVDDRTHFCDILTGLWITAWYK